MQKFFFVVLLLSFEIFKFSQNSVVCSFYLGAWWGNISEHCRRPGNVRRVSHCCSLVERVLFRNRKDQKAAAGSS